MKKELSYVTHEFDPIYFDDAKVLILGSMPSVKSKENGFYYSHPKNRFWTVLADVFSEEVPISKEERLQFLKRHHIALWDVIATCLIDGSSDSSIQQVQVNPIEDLLEKVPIEAIFTTGKKAQQLYDQYCLKQTKMEAVCLPSTSPANCRVSYEDLKKAYQAIRF